MLDYMRNHRKNKVVPLSGQKQVIRNAPRPTRLSDKVLTNTNAGLNKVLTDKAGLNTIKLPIRPEGISDNQYSMICVKAERA